MRIRRTLAYFVFASCVLLIAVKNRAAELRNEVRSGSWAITRAYARVVTLSLFSPPASQALESGVVGWMKP